MTADAGVTVKMLTNDNVRMRISDFRVSAGSTTTVQHSHPTLRWPVGAAGEATPTPIFFEPGIEHTVDNGAGQHDVREIVFEVLQGAEGVWGEEIVVALEGKARFKTLIGTALNFENKVCRATELRMAPSGGVAEDIMHQHVLDYGLCFLGGTHLKFWHPNLAGGKPELQKEEHLDDG